MIGVARVRPAYRGPVPVYAVLLRGVNVRGTRMAMADVRAALAGAGMTDVVTLLASGNAVGGFDGDADALRAAAERALDDRFGYDTRVLVVPAERLGPLLDACPLPADDPDWHTYVTVGTPAALDALQAALREADPALADAEVRLGPEATAWRARVGATLSDPRAAVVGRRPELRETTDRNLRTMLKVRAAAERLAAAG